MNRIRRWVAAAFCLAAMAAILTIGGAKAEAATAAPKVTNLVISVGSNGFHPSKYNYLRIKSDIPYSSNGAVTARLRIYNSAGKYVYQKTVSGIEYDIYDMLNGYSSGGYLYDLTWNGKPNKGNEAGLSTSEYVKSGTYKAEMTVWYTGKSKSVCSKKTRSFKVSSLGKTGAAGVAEAKTAPILTGDAQIDYMAERMIKSAGVTSTMSDDTKVKTIYHWMTRYFKHKHYDEMSSTDKEYYDLTALKDKIAAYKATNDSLVASGKMVYSFYGAGEVSNMVHRYGVCSDNSAVFKILLNHVGVEAGICEGYYLNRNGTAVGHTWAFALVNGKHYYYDIDVEIQNYGKGQGDYYWYKKTKTEALKTHEFYYEEDPLP